MIRDLIYPEDARKVIESLQAGLRYDATIAALGQGCSQLPVPQNTPDFSTPIRVGGIEEDKAVRRDAVGLLSRFSFISLVSRYEGHARLLLLQRRVLEELGSSGRKMTPERMWNILRRVNKEMRDGPVLVTSQYLVEHPSPALRARMKWLEGTYKVRNCLAHRLGMVEMIDVKPPRAPLESVKDTDTLKAIWLKPKLFIDSQEVVNFPHQHGTQQGKGEVKLEEYEREWKIGDVIHITPDDCQSVALSLSLLGNQVLAEFEQEMNSILAKPAANASARAEAIDKKPEVQSAPRTDVRRKQGSEPVSDKPSSEQETHFADFEFKRGSDVGVRLLTGHQWVCNASLPSWPGILITGLLEHLPSIYLCEHHASESGLQW